MNNIMLTGEKQVGKSTIINKIIRTHPGHAYGFQTLPDKETKQFYIQSMNGEYSKAYICKRNGNDRFIGLIHAFNDQGVSILKDCLKKSPDLIIMDELGIFENDAYQFHKYVHQCLYSPIPVLGVLKGKSSLFLDSIRNRMDTEVHTVTIENRNQVYKVVKNAMHN